jgi:hypothetical protein
MARRRIYLLLNNKADATMPTLRPRPVLTTMFEMTRSHYITKRGQSNPFDAGVTMYALPCGREAPHWQSSCRQQTFCIWWRRKRKTKVLPNGTPLYPRSVAVGSSMFIGVLNIPFFGRQEWTDRERGLDKMVKGSSLRGKGHSPFFEKEELFINKFCL